MQRPKKNAKGLSSVCGHVPFGQRQTLGDSLVRDARTPLDIQTVLNRFNGTMSSRFVHG
jgi:predicted metal-dependent peptidase